MTFRLKLIIILLIPTIGFSQEKWKPTKIYFVRHAETIANVTDVYTDSTESAFTIEGLKQIKILTRKLQPYNFDRIIVSPAWRTQHTIYPFLFSKKQTAEIWPEIIECCWKGKIDTGYSQVPFVIPYGSKIHVMDTSLFYFKDKTKTRIIAWETGQYHSGKKLCKQTAKILKQEITGKGLTVLIVGHGLHGRLLIKELTGESIRLKNASLKYCLVEQKDGSFLLKDI